MDKEKLKQILKKQELLSQQRLAQNTIVRHFSIESEIDKPEISIITGVRRAGKSLYLQQLKKNLSESYATFLVEFDDPALQDFQGMDFPLLVEIAQEQMPKTAKKLVLLLDEIQNVAQWEKWLIHIYKDPRIKIVITGSNAKLLSSELGTLLTGRHLSHELTPLSFNEVLSFYFPNTPYAAITEAQLLSSYDEYYTYGGFPRSFVGKDGSVLTQYFSDIVERDIIARHGARLIRPLKEFSRILCSNNTRIANLSRLAKELGVKDDGTIRRYSSWLGECYLFHEVKGFFPSVRKQIRSAPKFYCIDPCLARYSAFSVFGDEGSFLENMVYLELRRNGYDIHYWKSGKKDCEVDFICRKAGSDAIAIQVSLTTVDEKTFEREIYGLKSISRELGIKKLILITKNDSARTISDELCTIEMVPFIRLQGNI